MEKPPLKPRKETISKTLAVAFFVAVLCGIVVSIASVLLRPSYLANLEEEQRESLLQLMESQPGLLAFFESEESTNIEEQVVELDTGRTLTEDQLDRLQQRTHEKLFEQVSAIPPAFDIAGIHQRPNYLTVYRVKQEEGADLIILPVYGKGYASTLKGYLALDMATERVAGLSFYEHGETPGVGARLTDSEWLAEWQGKHVWDPSGALRLGVARKGLSPIRPSAIYEVDAISGATMTSRGIHNMIRFWLGDHGFGPFLEKYRKVDRSVHLLRSPQT